MPRVSADVRRDLLVDAAIRVMVRDGVAKATTRSIVAEAEMPLGAFHYCFRSKQELLENVIEAITGQTLSLALEVVAEDGTFYERLERGFAAYWAHVKENPDEHRVTYELTQYAVRQPGLADVARRQYETYLAAIRQVLEKLAETSGVIWSVPLPTVVRYMAAIIDGMTLLYLSEGDADAAAAALDLGAVHIASLAIRAN